MAKNLTFNGKPATQRNVLLEDEIYDTLITKGNIGRNTSFANYIRTLIDNDIKEKK